MQDFEHIQIQTTQNVRLRYEIASIGDRIFAYLIDAVIVYGSAFMIGLIYESAVGFNGSAKTVYGIVLVLIPLLFYHLLLEILNSGQSVGKKILKTKVVKIDGTEPTLGSYMIRWVSRIIEVSGVGYGIAVLVVLVNGKGQRLGDIAAGTAVAKVKSRVTLDDTILAFSTEGYTPVYVGAQYLSARDIETIKEALLYFDKYKNHHVLWSASQKVMNFIGVDAQQVSFIPEEFLKIIVNDFAYYKSIE